jgi:hypothetical protein
MPTILAFGGGGGGMKFVRQATAPTLSKYLDGSWAWFNTTDNQIYFYSAGAWRALNTWQ